MRVLGSRPTPEGPAARRRAAKASSCWTVRVPGGRVTEAGVRGNISVALQYLAAWLGGSGAVAINNLMEDAATAEIARSQLWQWIRHGAKTEDRRADHAGALPRDTAGGKQADSLPPEATASDSPAPASCSTG